MCLTNRTHGEDYYIYPDSQGLPTLTYTGIQYQAGQYFIPIVATIHTHNQCLSDGTDGVTNQILSTGDAGLAASFPTINHYIIGCGALGTFSTANSSPVVISTDPLSTSCSLIN